MGRGFVCRNQGAGLRFSHIPLSGTVSALKAVGTLECGETLKRCVAKLSLYVYIFMYKKL